MTHPQGIATTALAATGWVLLVGLGRAPDVSPTEGLFAVRSFAVNRFGFAAAHLPWYDGGLAALQVARTRRSAAAHDGPARSLARSAPSPSRSSPVRSSSSRSSRSTPTCSGTATSVACRAGALQPPSDFVHAGWYLGGPVPGEPGPAVIAGHVDSRAGPAIFFRLRDLRPGDSIEVTRSDRTVGFRVTAVQRYPKNAFPTRRVYRPTPDRALRLITCGGSFDYARRSYRHNVVVYAVAA